MQRLKWLIAGLLLYTSGAHADDFWRLSSFVQGIWQSKALSGADSRRLGVNDSFVESSVMLDGTLSDRLRLKAQVNARQPNINRDTVASLDVLSLRYRLYQPMWGQVSISGGRLKNALVGFYSAQDDPLSRPMTTHARVYLGNIPQVFSTIDGARLDVNWLSDAGHGLDAYLYIGQHVVDNNTTVTADPNVRLRNKSYDMHAIKLIYTSPTVPVAQLGLVAISFDSLNRIEIPRGALESQIQGDVFIGMGRVSGLQWELAGEYAWGNLKGISPAAASLPGTTSKTAPLYSGYAEVSWLPNPHWRLSLRYAFVEYPQLGYRQIKTFSGTSTSKGIIFYARYQLNRNLFTGVELDRITMDSQPEGHRTHSLAMFQLGLHF